MSEGKKYDDGKPPLDLLPTPFLAGAARAMAFGADKYGRENYLGLENGERRYVAAALRHVLAFRDGSTCDNESGLDHLAHAAACIAILMHRRDNQ